LGADSPALAEQSNRRAAERHFFRPSTKVESGLRRPL
jgi:hypothetical protein